MPKMILDPEPGHPFNIELAMRISRAERERRNAAEKAWHRHDYLNAVRDRGIADGLETARELLLQLISEQPDTQEATPQ